VEVVGTTEEEEEEEEDDVRLWRQRLMKMTM
jgi:hypothetical protein